MLRRVEDEEWAEAPGPSLVGAASPRSPAPSRVLFCKAGRPGAAQAPALVGSPLHPPQLCSALHPGLGQVGAGEWPLNPFTSQQPPQPCACPKQTIAWAQPRPVPQRRALQASPGLPSEFPLLFTHLCGSTPPCPLGSGRLGSVATRVPWQPGCHGTMGADLVEQQLWVTRAGKAQSPAPATLQPGDPCLPPPAEQRRP